MRQFHIFKRDKPHMAFKEVKTQEPIEIDVCSQTARDAIQLYIDRHVGAMPDGVEFLALEGGQGKYGQRYADTARIVNRTVPYAQFAEKDV